MNMELKQLPIIYLKPMEIHVSRSPALIKTVLGSCIAATMFNPRLKVASICHGVLPRCPNPTHCLNPCRDQFRYVDCCIRYMALRFNHFGIECKEIEVKLFGGAHLLQQDSGKTDCAVGSQNVEAALQALSNHGLMVLASDLEGSQGRKVYFNTLNGEVLLKRLPRQALI